MKNPSVVVTSALSAIFMLTGGALAQDAPEGMPSLPQPGAKQAVLKNDVGVWDATVEMFMAPDAPPFASTGVATNVMGCGGMCLIGEFQSEIMGQPFSGHVMTAYDAMKKKYVGMWVDSMSLGPSFSEVTYDPATKTMTGTTEGPDMSGQITQMVTRGEWKDADTRIESMYSQGPDGKDVLRMRISYKRRK
jgi:hypothetical protein